MHNRCAVCSVRCAVCGKVNVWLGAAYILKIRDTIILQHMYCYLCRVLVIPYAVFVVLGGAK